MVTQPDVSDARLVERAQSGDREAMDEIVARYQTRAYQFAYRLAGNADDASDLVAEAFVRVYTAIQRFRRESQFSTWLFRIITNCFLDRRKKEQRRQTQTLDDALVVDDERVSTSVDVESPTESSERNERQRVMEDAIAKLPEYQRAMIVMFHVEMLSYEEIAHLLDTPIGTVKSRLNRARLGLRELLEPHEELFVK
ncbi:MAG: sigma-70 family RNA polymerase sigma factor [Fimbriimonadales bacterium]